MFQDKHNEELWTLSLGAGLNGYPWLAQIYWNIYCGR